MPTRRFRLGVRLPYSPAPVPQPKPASISLVDFLAVAQQHNVYFMPVGPQASLGALGRGISGIVTQSTADMMTSFAFKPFIPSDYSDEGVVDHVLSSLITEILVMQHEPIRRSLHIIDLIGVCWDVDVASKKVWPVVVTPKANCGDLENFLFENRDITSETRFQLCANIAEAAGLLHSCGIAHGDLKPENMLIQRSKDGDIKLKIIDFGASAFGDQMRRPFVSTPWNAPESVTSREIPASAMILSDLYSFGLLCIQILLPRDILADANLFFMHRGQTTGEWEKTLDNVEILKQGDSLATKLMSLVEMSELPNVHLRLLHYLIPHVVCSHPDRRLLNWKELRDIFAEENLLLSNAISSESHSLPLSMSSTSPESCNHNVLDIMADLGEFDDIDYLLRTNIVEDMLCKIPSITCSECLKRIKFQVACSYRIGFGVPRNKDQSEHWLRHSGMKQGDMDTAISRLKQSYRPTGRLADQVKNAIGFGILVSLERVEHYQIEGRLVEAGEVLSREISDREREFGDDHISAANLKSELAQIYRLRCLLNEAHELQLDVIAIRSQALGKNHPSVITSIGTLTLMISEQGRLREAEELQREVLRGLEQQLGEEHPDTITALHYLGVTLELQKYHKDAETIFKKVLELRTKILTIGHPLTIRASVSLLSCLRDQGKFQKAERLMLDIQSRSTTLVGDDFVANGILQMSMAVLHYAQSRFDEAESIGVKVVDSFKRELGEHDLKTLQAREVLVDIYHAKWQPKEAEKHLSKSLEVAKSLGERHPIFLKQKTSLAENLLMQQKFSESIVQAQEVLSIFQGSITMNPDIFLACTDYLARGYEGIGRMDEAEDKRSQLVLSCRRDLGDKHPLTIRAISAFAGFLMDQALWREAEALQKELYLGSKELLEHNMIAIRLNLDLAWIYLEQGRFSDCEKLVEDAISWSEECYGESHLETKLAINFLVTVYVYAGLLDKAESLYVTKLSSGCDGFSNTRFTIEVNSILGKLRLAQGKLKEAQEHIGEAVRLSKITPSKGNKYIATILGTLLAAKLDEKLTDEVEAETLCLIQRKEQLFGEKHATTLVTISDLGHSYALNGRLEDAAKLFGKLENFLNQNTVQNPLRFTNICFKRAEFYFRTQKYHEARKEEEMCLRIRQEILGDEHPKTLIIKASLSSTLNALEMYDEAEKYMRQVLEVRLNTLPVNDMLTLRSKNDLAAILFYQNRLEESEDLYAAVVDASLKTLGNCAFTRHEIECLNMVRARRRGL